MMSRQGEASVSEASEELRRTQVAFIANPKVSRVTYWYV